MNLKKVSIITLACIITVSIIYDNFYTIGMVMGKYIYNFPVSVVDGPNQGHTLLLKEDGTFESDSWGNGTFKIKGSELDLSYRYEYGIAGYEMTIYRPLYWGKPRLRIDRDLNYYFQKKH